MPGFFSFFQPRQKISGHIVDLIQEEHHLPGHGSTYESYDFGIYFHHTAIRIGQCDLRIGMNRELYYAGNIGYRIYAQYRGHGYAYDACQLLLVLARDRFHMQKVIITCSPENIASRMTLEKLGGTKVETVPVPHDHWLCQRGETVKIIYLYPLSRN
ncbi:MAG: GNAT family N-acetyltransferase [Erysipelotrichaceae bacterium]|jgi:predicted acetyltransferase|nr:GNAT family N-acetyltransferase [Erysipelotrichaceae bacterium]MCI1325526.1 GNAT family N-acetyltransferase [Solobacterium sp.]MCH4044370.1 GNAT family N-acetyltransferase [Erysipelotrichaceae bacterium]MCH4121583.1 GNAT family N-acetyltransferase [Erysipelotrichaceae bacterium]MCI1363262.1 GNAT family N-acetyltransferase [Solobacterium sp.]